jgi:hypothetical protein
MTQPIRIIAALLAWLPLVASAQQQVNIFAFEDASCGAWKKSQSNKLLRAQYEFWIRGFVSGHNYADPARQVKVGALPGSEGLYGYIDNYCNANPTLSFVGGVIALVQDLREPAPAKTPPRKPGVNTAPAAK